MQLYISDVNACETANMLKLSDNKTERIIVASKTTKYLHNLRTSITFSISLIPFKQFVRNFGLIILSS